MSDYRALIANCLMLGERFGIVGGKKYLNLINLSLDKFDVELEENPDIVSSNFGDFKGIALHTTNLHIKNLTSTQFEDVELVATEVAELMSLATCSSVQKCGYNFEGKGSLEPVIGQVQYFRPSIDTHRGALVRSFLEKTWPAYHQVRNDRKLNVAFQYYVLSQQNELPMELLLVISFVLLENLKHNFALYQGYPYLKGYFRLKGATTSKPGQKKTFEELLEEMFQQVGMTPTLASIIQLRNELIHSGISTLDTSTQTAIYDKCQDIIREYLLKFLGYTGQYYPYSSPNRPSIIS